MKQIVSCWPHETWLSFNAARARDTAAAARGPAGPCEEPAAHELQLEDCCFCSASVAPAKGPAAVVKINYWINANLFGVCTVEEGMLLV